MTATELAARLMPESMVGCARVSRSVIAGTQELIIANSPLLFQLIMILAQSLQSGYNPLRDTISSLVWGHSGWLQTVNFLLFGGLMMAFAKRFRLPAANGIRPRTGSILLYLIGAGFIILAVCPSQSPEGLKTIQSIIHGLTVYFMTFSFPAACFLLAPGLRNGKRSGPIFFYTVVTGCLGLILIALGILLVAVGAHWFGMLERLLLLNGFAWLEIVGVYCMKLNPESQRN